MAAAKVTYVRTLHDRNGRVGGGADKSIVHRCQFTGDREIARRHYEEFGELTADLKGEK